MVGIDRGKALHHRRFQQSTFHPAQGLVALHDPFEAGWIRQTMNGTCNRGGHVAPASYTGPMTQTSPETIPELDPTVARAVGDLSDRLGAREWLRSLDYFRCIEYPLAVQALNAPPGTSLLDMGCGTGPFSLFLARHLGLTVTATDLDEACVAWQRRGANRLDLDANRFTSRSVDSRRLPFADGSFARVLNLGSIEHVRDADGDSQAIREVARVLAPGGRAVLTIPYGPRYEEIDRGPHVPDFERRYDDPALARRLVAPSGLDEISRTHYGEAGTAFSAWWYRTPRILQLPFRRLTLALAQRFLTVIPPEERASACGVCLVLERSR
jgi:SAM-dependent methyltransferase